MSFVKQLVPAVLLTLVLTVLLGLVYPLAVTGLALVLFPQAARGSLIVEHGRVVGSRLIGQAFSGAGFFHGRPSAAGSGYDPLASGGSNLGPTSRDLAKRVAAGVAALGGDRLAAGSPAASIPVDLVTASGSGLDPHISPAAAELQVDRVASQRGLPTEVVRRLVRQATEGRQWGFLGEPRVNVLALNLALRAAAPPLSPAPPAAAAAASSR